MRENEPQQRPPSEIELGRRSSSIFINSMSGDVTGDSQRKKLVYVSKNGSVSFQYKMLSSVFSQAMLATSYMLNIYCGVGEKTLWFMNVPVICIVSSLNFILSAYLEASLNKIDVQKMTVTLANNSFLTNSNLRIMLLLLIVSLLSAYYAHSPLAIFLQLFYRFWFCVAVVQSWNQQTKTSQILSTIVAAKLTLNMQPINDNYTQYAEIENKKLNDIMTFIQAEHTELKNSVSLIRTHYIFILISTLVFFAMSFIVLSKDYTNIRFIIALSVYFCVLSTKPLLMASSFNNIIRTFESKTSTDTQLRIHVYGYEIDKFSLRGIAVGYVTNFVYLMVSHVDYLYTQK